MHVAPVQLVERSRLAGSEAAAELFVREAMEQEPARVLSTGAASPRIGSWSPTAMLSAATAVVTTPVVATTVVTAIVVSLLGVTVFREGCEGQRPVGPS